MALSKLAVRRLTKLADFMATLPRSANKHFDMTSTEFYGCGTSACAAGWGERVPGWEKMGYSYNKSPRFFDIHDSGIDNPWAQLFYDENSIKCKTPKQWAKHCRKFIKANT